MAGNKRTIRHGIHPFPFLHLSLDTSRLQNMLPQISFLTPALFMLSLSSALAIIQPLRNPALVVEKGLLVANISGLDYDLAFTNINASPQCNGARYGRNLSPASCDEVLEFFIPAWDDPVMEFGQRGSYAGPNKLPMRLLSCKLLISSPIL